MGDREKELNAITPARFPRSGQLGPTGPAPLLPSGGGSGLGTKIRHSVLVQCVTGTAWIGQTGLATGAGYQLGPVLSSTGYGLEDQTVRVHVDDLSRVWVHTTQGMVKWIAD